MITLLSLITSVKDYVEITHKVLEADLGTNASNLFSVKSYDDFGAVLTFLVLSFKDFLIQFFSLSWLKNIWSLPIIVPDISSAMLSEVSVFSSSMNSNSVLTSYNGLNFLEVPLASVQQNLPLYSFEKFFIGFLNSIFLILPTSASHLITLRRFVMQGVDAGYYAGLGTLAGNILWFSSIIFGWRFFVIPWLSFDIFRYFFGFLLIAKYLWDCTKEKRMTLEDLSKWKIFLLNFLLALTEQTCVFPFITNLSFGPESSLLDAFSTNTIGQQGLGQFIFIHGAYIFGLFVGSFSLLQFCCWFWEYPAFTLYLWLGSKTNYQFTTRTSYKTLNFIFTYLTMLFAISSVPYYGLEYTLTNPLGFLPQDRLLTQKPSIQSQSDYERLLPEASFLNVKSTNLNMRVRDGQRARRERWKQQFIKYQSFDTSVYDQNVYDFLTVEDLNYGFDRFWFRRKMRNHFTHFRLFPGPWMRSLKKQLVRPNRDSRGTEFFTLLFEQYYHPNFHKIQKENQFFTNDTKKTNITYPALQPPARLGFQSENSVFRTSTMEKGNQLVESSSRFNVVNNYLIEKKASATKYPKGKISALRKFVRNVNTRIKAKEILSNNKLKSNLSSETQPVYSKRWKHFYSKFWRGNLVSTKNPLRSFSKNIFFNTANVKNSLELLNKKQRQLATLDSNLMKTSQDLTNSFKTNSSTLSPLGHVGGTSYGDFKLWENYKLTQAREKLSKKDRLILRYRSELTQRENNTSLTMKIKAQTMFHPLKFYLQKEEAFRRKLKFYGSTVFRKFSIGNNAPYLRTIMKRGFFYYKPSLRLKRTSNVAALRRGFRKKSRIYKKQINNDQLMTTNGQTGRTTLQISQPMAASSGILGDDAKDSLITKPSHFYSATGKRASRYRSQIYKDVLQHWYYTPFNRFLLKFDIDAFINRQPRTQFLTTKEEQLLHLRRFLLSEHYESLRWYTFMQHYRAMKTNIGGTKSFASRTYNQQFQGTFKKIRHLFAITPLQTNQTISKQMIDSTKSLQQPKETPSLLKFDQPLFNESKTTPMSSNGMKLHEELLVPSLDFREEQTDKGIPVQSTDSYNQVKSNSIEKIDLISKSTRLVGEFLTQGKSIREQHIKSLIDQNSYSEFMNFLSNNDSYFKMLETTVPNQNLIHNELSSTDTVSTGAYTYEKPEGTEQLKKEFWFQILKQSKRRINNQKFLKKYINHRISKREKRNLQKQKTLKTRLKRLQTWLTPSALIDLNSETTTGLNKAIKQSLTLSNTNQPNYLSNLPLFSTKNHVTNSLNSLKTILDTNAKSSGFSDNQLKIITKTKQTLNSLKNVFVQKSKPFYFFLKQRYTRYGSIKNWKKRQKVKAKNQQQRKKLETTMAVSESPNMVSTVFSTNKSVTNPINKKTLANEEFTNQESNNTEFLRYKLAEKELTNKTSIGKFKQAMETLSIADDSNNKNVSFVKKTWQKFFSKKFNKKMSKKGKRSYFYPQNLQTLLKFEKPKLVNKRTIKNLSKEKKQRIVKQGGIVAYVANLDENSISSRTKLKDQALSTGQPLSESTGAKNFEFVWTKTNISKTNQSKKRKRRKAKRKYPNFKNRLRKYTKRRIFRKGKIKTFAKRLKKLQASLELQLWWWQKYIPKFETNLQKANMLNQSSFLRKVWYKPLEITLDKKPEFNTTQTAYLPMGLRSDTSYKNNLLDFSNQDNNLMPLDIKLNKLYEQLYLNQPSNSVVNDNQTVLNPFPYYAGWDDSLRKFVITNRFLSRRDAGLYSSSLSSLGSTEIKNPALDKNTQTIKTEQIFTKTPVFGLNEANFLYWQNEMPFKSFNIEQFNTNVTSFYAPIGWRRFQFRHSILNTWLNQGQSIQNQKPSGLKFKVQLNSQLTFNNAIKQIQYKQKRQSQKFESRRLTKRYKLSKNAPASFTFKPPGPLLTEVLPSHYLAVFNAQYRLPRHRYLKYKLLKHSKISQDKTNILKQTTNVKQQDPLSATAELNQQSLNSFSLKDTISTRKVPSFTLRKRIKPKRKFHRKRSLKAGGLIFPRRRTFVTHGSSVSSNETIDEKNLNLRWRPTTDYNKTKIDSLNLQKTRLKTDTIRRRKLRRKVFKQIFKPMPRFQPRYGGFIWSGDYPRLEFTDMPKLATLLTNNEEAINKIQRQQKTKEKRKISPMVGVLPHTNLIEQHNILVLKKKLEKAQRSNKIPERVQELKLMYKTN